MSGLQPVYRGGNWNNGSEAGSFYLNGNNEFTNWNYNIGARLGYSIGTSTTSLGHPPRAGKSPEERA